MSFRSKSNARAKKLDDQLQDMTSLMDELDANLEQYTDRKADVRAALKKLNDTSQEWVRILNALAGEPSFDESRKEAIESCEDLADDAKRLLTEQTDYFNEHEDSEASSGRCQTRPRLPARPRRACYPQNLVVSELIIIFQEEYRALRPRAPMPPFSVRFRRFTSLNTTIRLREGHVSRQPFGPAGGRAGAGASRHRPYPFGQALQKPIEPAQNHRYKRFASSAAVTRQTELIRGARGSKRYSGPQGRYYNLEEVFESLNERFFNGLMGRPELTWSEHNAKRSLGHYDAAHNTIVVSRVFDRPSSPRYAVEYLLYHEMLHLKHPVKMNGIRRCVHSREFKAEERQFPQLKEALAFLKRL